MDGSTNSSDSGFEVHEVIFAESLGVNLQEEFALELLDIATRALYILPEGWEVDFAESELGSIPFFYDSNTDQSHWVHPYAQDLKMLIEEKRLQLLRGEDLFNEEDELAEDESNMFEDSEDVSTNRVNESFELEALPSRLKPIDGIPEEAEDSHSLSEPMPQISETEETSEKDKEVDTVESIEPVLEPPVDTNAPDVPNGVSSDELATVGEGPVDETKDVAADESNAIDTIAPIVQPDEPLVGIGAGESSKELQADASVKETVVESNETSEQQVVDSDATMEPQPEGAGSSESKDTGSEKAPQEERPEEIVVPPSPKESVKAAPPAEEPTVSVPVDPPVVAPEEATQQAEPENVETTAKPVEESLETASVDAPDAVQPEATVTAEISPVIDSASSAESLDAEPSNQQVDAATIEASVVVAEESPVAATEPPAEEVTVEAAPDVVNEAAVDSTVSATEPPSVAAEETLTEAVALPAGEPPVEVDVPAASEPEVVAEPIPEPVAEEQPITASVEAAQPATPEKVQPLALTQTTPPPAQSTTVEVQESQSQKSTPKSARPLPVDPFADFFSIDPSLHTFIDTLEKKKKKKVQQKAQGKGKKDASAATDDEGASVDIDEILRRRRQTERAKEEARFKREQEAEAKRLAAEQKKRAAEEEKLRKAQEKEERERQERLAKEEAAKKQAEAAAAAEEEVRRKKEADDAAAALAVTVPAVTAPSPPSLDRTVTISDELAATTKSLFDDLVAKESVPEEDDADAPRLSVSRSVDRFGLASPVTAVPLDRSIDIMDHFRNIYSAGSSNEQPSPIPHAPTSASGTSRTLLRQTSVRYVPGVASMAETHDGAIDGAVHKPRGLDTTKLVTRDPAKKKRKKAAAAAAASSSDAAAAGAAGTSSGSSPPPKLKPHVTTPDGWVVLGAYANYKEAERAVALFEALAPTKSIAGQSFPSHSKFLPPVKGPDTSAATAGLDDTAMGDGTSPLKKKSLLASNAPITKESILLSTQQELPQTRIARDLGRMQWLVECNDPSMKKLFERRIAKRLRHGHGAEKLLAHLSPAKQQALGLDPSSSSSPSGGGDGKLTDSSAAMMLSSSTSPLKNVGRKFTAAFTPQALISNKNTKHVSGQMHIQYPLPRVAYDDKKPLPAMTSSLSPTNRTHTSNNNNNNNNQHRGPMTFRAVLHDAAAMATGGNGSGKVVHSSPGGRRDPTSIALAGTLPHGHGGTTGGGGGVGGALRPASTYA